MSGNLFPRSQKGLTRSLFVYTSAFVLVRFGNCTSALASRRQAKYTKTEELYALNLLLKVTGKVKEGKCKEYISLLIPVQFKTHCSHPSWRSKPLHFAWVQPPWVSMKTDEPTTKDLAATPQSSPEPIKVAPLPGLSFLLLAGKWFFSES